MKLENKAFTLAEVLITLAIIGVVAAISIPSVISNSQQQEFKTGLRKAVSVLNSAITMNMALDGETPYDNANLFGFLMKHMAIINSLTDTRESYYITVPSGAAPFYNKAFYTTDGMRFEFRAGGDALPNFKLYETSSVLPCTANMVDSTLRYDGAHFCGGCGSYGLNSNSDNTTKPPCIIMVDVNGDKKPNPNNVNCKTTDCGNQNKYKFSDPTGIKLTDVFSVMVTDKSAVPYGIAAQRAMYQAQK